MKMKRLAAMITLAIVIVYVGVLSSGVDSTCLEDVISIDKIIVQDSALITEEARDLTLEAAKDGRLTAIELKRLYDHGARIIAVENLNDPSVRKHVRAAEYDLIIPGNLAIELDSLLALEYKEKYGYLPDEIGITKDKITEDELKKLVEEGRVEIGDAPPINASKFQPPGDPDQPPYAYNGRIFVHLYPAKDTAHTPAEGANWRDVAAAIAQFETKFGVNMIQIAHYNSWDASDAGDSISALLIDLAEDVPNSGTNMVVMGWVDNSDHNGQAQLSGYYSVCAERPTYWRANWPDDSVAQHELSHNFDAQDGGQSGEQCTNLCVMDYYDAWMGTDKWCNYHSRIICAGVWGSVIER